MRALVTGGAGFIGSNLVDVLVGRGDEVTILDDLSTGRRENLNGAARLVVGDVTDDATVLGAAEGAEVIFHLAAQVDVRKSVADPRRDLAVNGAGCLAVLDAARSSGARVVYASTGGAVYGEAEVVPTPEDAPLRPLSPYGVSKLAGEMYMRLYRQVHGVRACALRFANVYGPRQDPLGEGGVVAIYCGRLLSGETAAVYGDGRQTRDFTFVGDVVEACLKAAASDDFGPYNVGTGKETSVLELAAMLEGLSIEHEPARPGEVQRSCLDPARAASALGWTAATPIERGLSATLASLRA